MNDKRVLVAFLVSMIFVMVYTELFLSPTPTPIDIQKDTASSQHTSGIKESRGRNDGTGGVVSQNNSTDSLSAGATQNTGVTKPYDITRDDILNAPRIELSSPLYTATISLLGGQLTSFELSNYKEALHSTKGVNVVHVIDQNRFPGVIYVRDLNDSTVRYSLISPQTRKDGGTINLKISEETPITLSGVLPDGRKIEKTYKFYPDTYLTEIKVVLHGINSEPPHVSLEWLYSVNKHKQKRYFFDGLMIKTADGIEKLRLSDVPDIPQSASATWAALGDTYFESVVIPEKTGINIRYFRNASSIIVHALAEDNLNSFKVYIGPKKIDILDKVGYNLRQTVDLGFFAVLAHPLLSLLNLFAKIFNNYGLAIIFLTILIKAMFLPLTRKSFESMSAMQKLQPKMQELRAKYKNDPNRLNREIMELYKKENVNPLGGCLPVLIQIPVFLGLYNALSHAIELRHAEFALWIHDLSAPERLHIFGVGVPVMVILMGISMVLQQYLTPSSMDPSQKKIMIIMSIVFTFFFMAFPAGLTLYWLVNNLISLIQQFYIRRGKAEQAGKATLLGGIFIFGLSYVLTLF